MHSKFALDAASALCPENSFDRIGDAIVHRDIDSDSNPEFSRRYLLNSPHEVNAPSSSA